MNSSGSGLVTANLEETVHPAEQTAAMWAAANPDTFLEMQAKFPRVRTVRGVHAKWKALQKFLDAEPEEDGGDYVSPELGQQTYDAAKSAARMQKVKQAHDSLMVQVHTSQAHALAIRARAEMRLAEEYDQAKADGGVPSQGGDRRSEDFKTSSARFDRSSLGLNDPELADARRLRDAEAAEPGLIQRSLNAMVAASGALSSAVGPRSRR